MSKLSSAFSSDLLPPRGFAFFLIKTASSCSGQTSGYHPRLLSILYIPCLIFQNILLILCSNYVQNLSLFTTSTAITLIQTTIIFSFDDCSVLLNLLPASTFALLSLLTKQPEQLGKSIDRACYAFDQMLQWLPTALTA